MSRNLGVTELVRNTLPEWTVPIFEVTALFGDEFLVVGVLGLFAIAGAYQAASTSDTHRLVPDRTAFVLAVVLGGLALTLVLKTAFGSPRPPESLQAVPRESDGFPSGHTMAATVLWGALATWSLWSTARRRTIVAASIIGLVAFSRLALGVHFLVDVLASVAFGLGYLYLAARLTNEQPAPMFAGAVGLGTIALLITSGETDGWLAFAGCVGGAAAWWVSMQPRVQDVWTSITQ
ncbi:PA-phosphatase-like phosphoesterase [Natrialba hulunbeirensis JCM 10989]|uniref:PA-phosphatase-like phosphoesterase n=1 Tax=Natrialba hulunbeirensis JCM 10989 TaxID=1227493 RepID=M0AD21_9EURY|nr:phosphatase PAP2 family protein [Natrialba hulunbeirensis]ELY95762.1 PA-phosphatase-like phosphoesterase [Natrialba hulunbeirensis JCM 10989]